uniref:Aspartyl proteinase n=1 Tax=Ganoderma boninense TaxID=34458 RepID=A0A5K1JVK6_9APHY|nr:Aspartyl proteinase [Ganoderma boninense]
MARISTLLSLYMTVVAASGTPVVIRDSPISLPLVRRFNLNSTGAGAILAADRARAEVLKNVGFSKGANISKRENFVVSNADICYTAEVGIGSPPTTYKLIVDTGSANTFVGANKSYVKTSTSHDTGKAVVSLLAFMGTGGAWVLTVTLPAAPFSP